MVKKVITFVAEDGKEFKDEQEALDYETIQDCVLTLLDPDGERDSTDERYLTKQDVVDFLIENREALHDYLKPPKKDKIPGRR